MLIEIYIGLIMSILSLSFDNVGNYMIYYFILDLLFFKKKNDIIIHHIIIIGMFGIRYLLNFSDEDYFNVFHAIIFVEISNIFLLLGKIIDKKYITIRKIINALFILTFFYYRIYYYYNECIPDNSTIMTIMDRYIRNTYEFIYVRSIFMTFFTLNIYWGIQIIAMIVRQLILFYKKCV